MKTTDPIDAAAEAIADAVNNLRFYRIGAEEAICSQDRGRLAAIIRQHLGDALALRQSHAELVEALERIAAAHTHRDGHCLRTVESPIACELVEIARTALQHAKEVAGG